LGAATDGVGLVAGAALECGVGVLAEWVGSTYGEGAGNGAGYLDFLVTVGRLAG